MYHHGFRSVYRLNAHIVLVVKYRKYFYNKPYFWTGSYFVASCGGITVEQLKKYIKQQATPEN